MTKKWISAESGIFLLTRRRYPRWLLPAVLVVVIVLAADVYRQQTNQPPAVFAQSCETPTISLYSGGAEYVNYSIKYTSDISEPESYEYQLKLTSETGWSDIWTPLPITSYGASFVARSDWLASNSVRGLLPLTQYSLRARAKCGASYSIPTNAEQTTTGKTKTYTMTLENANGVSVTSLTEGESGTLKLTLDPSEVVYTIPITISISLHIGHLSTTERGEVLIATGTGSDSSNVISSVVLGAGSRVATWTLTAVADAVTHDASPDDDEAEVERVFLFPRMTPVTQGAIRLSGTGLDGYVGIRDGLAVDPPPPPPTRNRPATGTVNIFRNREVLTSVLVSVNDEYGEPPGGWVFTYQWHRGTPPDLTPLPGEESSEYRLTTADIGLSLTLEVYFEDLLGNVETLSGSRGPITWGPDIEWSTGPERGPYAHETLVANTDLMFYVYLPADRFFVYQWIYVDANGNLEDEILGATSRTYELSSVDVGKYIQVGVAYESTEVPPVGEDPESKTRLANKQTPEVQEAIYLSSPEDLTANVASGVLTVSWTFVPGIGVREPTDFQYRYSPFDPADYTARRSSEGWQTVPGGSNARSFVLRENLINAAVYTIQVRSVDELFLADAASDTDLSTTVTTTATYRHRTDPC